MTVAPSLPAIYLVRPGQRFEGLAIASVGKRMGAYALDVAIGLGIYLSFVFSAAAGQNAYPRNSTEFAAVGIAVPIALLVLVVSAFLAVGYGGWTFGKLIFGLRTVDATSYRRIGFWRAALRAVILVPLSFSVLWFVLLIVSVTTWDRTKRNQAWHDRAVSSLVLDGRVGINPLRASGPFAPPALVRVGIPDPVAVIAPPLVPFAADAAGPVDVVVVERDGAVFGYLWFSDLEHAAGFIPGTAAARQQQPNWTGAFADAAQRGYGPAAAVDEARYRSRNTAMGTVAPSSLGTMPLAEARELPIED